MTSQEDLGITLTRAPLKRPVKTHTVHAPIEYQGKIVGEITKRYRAGKLISQTRTYF